MESATTFYQTLTGISFTLLGLWFAVMQFGHGDWRNDPHRHRSTLHIALHFFLPGMLGLGSLLSTPVDGGLVWRTTFVIGASIGVVESVGFIVAPHGPTGGFERTLRGLDPVLYALLLLTAFVPPAMFALSPLQLGGIVTGVLFLTGLCYVWLAFAERPPVPRPRRADGC
jgi:hypothetical protein